MPTMTNLKPETRAKLKTVSAATVCTALYKKGLRNQYMQNVYPLNPDAGPMVGEAFTLRFIPAREDLSPMAALENRQHPQRKAIEELPCPAQYWWPTAARTRARPPPAASWSHG